jgi:hypothetical protein
MKSILLLSILLIPIIINSCDQPKIIHFDITIISEGQISENANDLMPEYIKSFVKPITIGNTAYIPDVVVVRKDISGEYKIEVEKELANKIRNWFGTYKYVNLEDDYNDYLPKLTVGKYLSKKETNNNKKEISITSGDIVYTLPLNTSSNDIVKSIKDVLNSNKNNFSQKFVIFLKKDIPVILEGPKLIIENENKNFRRKEINYNLIQGIGVTPIPQPPVFVGMKDKEQIKRLIKYCYTLRENSQNNIDYRNNAVIILNNVKNSLNKLLVSNPGCNDCLYWKASTIELLGYIYEDGGYYWNALKNLVEARYLFLKVVKNSPLWSPYIIMEHINNLEKDFQQKYLNEFESGAIKPNWSLIVGIQQTENDAKEIVRKLQNKLPVKILGQNKRNEFLIGKLYENYEKTQVYSDRQKLIDSGIPATAFPYFNNLIIPF